MRKIIVLFFIVFSISLTVNFVILQRLNNFEKDRINPLIIQIAEQQRENERLRERLEVIINRVRVKLKIDLIQVKRILIH